MRSVLTPCIILVCCILQSCEKHATSFITPSAAIDTLHSGNKVQRHQADYVHDSLKMLQDSLSFKKILERAMVRAINQTPG
jgi:hypothetical protein